MYTFELYPSHSLVSTHRALLPARRADRAADRTQQGGHPAAPRGGRLPVQLGGTSKANCGPLYDSFQTPTAGSRTRSGPIRRRAAPGSAPTRPPRPARLGDGPIRVRRARHRRQGRCDVGSYDVDGGVTTSASQPVTLPATVGALSFKYYLAHSSNSSSRRLLPGVCRDAAGVRTVVRQEVGAANNDLPAWKTATISMTPWAGQTVRIVFARADRSRASTVEAAVDDVRIQSSP